MPLPPLSPFNTSAASCPFCCALLTPAFFTVCRTHPLAAFQVQVAFTIVRYATDRFGERQGVATSWLNALCAPLASSRSGAGGNAAADGGAADGAPANGSASAPTSPIRLPIFLRRGGAFGPPDSLATPLVMIGPGTGVAPFRGFLQHRRAQAAAQGGGGEGVADGKGTAWLFFGCRREDQDFLYKDDLQASAGVLQCCCICCCCTRSPVQWHLLCCGKGTCRRV